MLATHWHDDHIGGLADLVDACPNAKFCCAAPLVSSDFLDLLALFNKRPISKATGLSEIQRVFSIVKNRRSHPSWLLEGSPVALLPEVGPAPEARITALSPVHAEYSRFIESLAKHVPDALATKFKFPARDENDISVAVTITVGNIGVLLGADLETRRDANRGWNAVLSSTTRSNQKSTLFKVPHHGSETGHHDGVWAEMLIDEPVAVLTPWNRGSKLPTAGDRARTRGLAQRSFITSRITDAPILPANYAVAKTIRESDITISGADGVTGRITARLPLNAAIGQQHNWSIELSDEASDLNY